jgi:hypothetical protein
MNWLEIIGFIASAVVAISLMMRNVFWLRVINGIGALIFTVYGALIHSAPVAVMNGFVLLIDMYYLSQSFQSDYFKVLEVEPHGYYLRKFLSFYDKEIKKFMPEFTGDIAEETNVFFILRNMVPAGLLVTREHEDGKLWVEMDFAIPAYRDSKIGKYVYAHQAEIFDVRKHKAVYCEAVEKTHQKYLKRMGFVQQDGSVFSLELHQAVHRLEKDLV